MLKGKMKERLQGVVVGAGLMVALLSTMPVLARVAQETININYNNIKIAVDRQYVETEFEPFIYQGRTYLPVRDVAESIGYGVTWDDSTNTVHLTSDKNVSILQNNPAPTYQQSSSTSSANTSSRSNKPTSHDISLQKAIEIAEADLVKRGITATYHNDSGMDWENGQWVWELEFKVSKQDRGRNDDDIEYYINVDNGSIIKFEWED